MKSAKGSSQNAKDSQTITKKKSKILAEGVTPFLWSILSQVQIEQLETCKHPSEMIA